jgi:hypothetical protein
VRDRALRGVAQARGDLLPHRPPRRARARRGAGLYDRFLPEAFEAGNYDGPAPPGPGTVLEPGGEGRMTGEWKTARRAELRRALADALRGLGRALRR